MLTDEEVAIATKCANRANPECSRCEFRDAPVCTDSLIAALLSDRAELKVEVQRLEAAYMQMGMRAAELEYTVQHHEQEIERLRAVAKAARWVTPYIPDVGETTYCHPMHHGYHGGQFHTVYVTKREQEQFFDWGENFRDALAALEGEA